MKKFVALIIILISGMLAIPSDYQVKASGTHVLYASTNSQTYQVADATVEDELLNASTTVEKAEVTADLETPKSTLDDVMNVPAKGSGTDDWLYYGLGVALYIFYNFVVRLFPTARSWTTGAMLYRLGNLLLKDRSVNGGIMRIRNDTK